MERALLVTIKFDSEKDSWKVQDMAQELEELVRTTGAQIVDNIIVRPDKPRADLLIGKGKVDEITMIAADEDIDTVIFSHDLGGTQQRNLEEIIGKKTIDRTQLILDIFARHARSPEGVMQVELAQLQYLMPRLVGKGVILSRLGGGIGTRGPGEQKLEVDRRRIRKHIDKLKQDLAQLMLRRNTMRKKRKDEAMPLVSLVGYTNAGKSTLLNALTNAGQLVHNSLFTTLDPLSRACKLPNGEKVIISDTVGFLHQLPHHLIEAFKATLEEVVEADLLIHVLDVNNPMIHEHKEAVYSVLRELKADDKPVITALNKIDLLQDKSWLEVLKKEFVNPVAISAKLKTNIEELLEKVSKEFKPKMTLLKLSLPMTRMDLVNILHRQGQVKSVDYTSKRIKIEVNLPKIAASKILSDKDIEQID